MIIVSELFLNKFTSLKLALTERIAFSEKFWCEPKVHYLHKCIVDDTVDKLFFITSLKILKLNLKIVFNVIVQAR